MSGSQPLIPANTTVLQPASIYYRLSDAFAALNATNQINQLQSQGGDQSAQIAALSNQLTALSNQVQTQAGQIQSLLISVVSLNGSVATLQAEINTINARLAAAHIP